MAQQDLSPAMRARYGVRPTPPGLIALVVVAVAVFVVLIGWITWRLGSPDTQSKLLTFRVVDDHQVDVTFEVRRDSTSTTTCVLRAQDASHLDVGYATVVITPGREYVQPTYPLRTLARATAAEVLDCSSGAPRVDPPQFRPGTTNPAQVPTVDGS